MELARYLQRESILLSPQAWSKKGLLTELVEGVARASGSSVSAREILEQVLKREEIRSTGFGKGLAVAHARMDVFPKMCAAVARPKGPVEWESLDGEPVQFVILVVGGTAQEAAYLQILSEITKLWARKESRTRLLVAKTEDEVMEIIAEAKVRTHRR